MPQISIQNERIQSEAMSLEEIAKIGAQKMLAAALEAEVQHYIEQYAHLKTPDAHQAVVRNGYHPARKISGSFGTVEARVPRSRSRGVDVPEFASALVPKYLRKSAALTEALPFFYLGGLSNGDFIPCFEKLYGDTSGMSSASITRLKQIWKEEHKAWQQRDLSTREYCYLWVDGIHFNLRLEEGRLCVLVVIGVLKNGRKELVGVAGGYRESAESWRDLLRSLKEQGMPCPQLCIGDGALGFWKAVRDVYPEAKGQRCWVHKTANILDKMPKSVQPMAKTMIHNIYQADTLKDAEAAYRKFIKQYEAKYYKAVECLTKDEDMLFTFYSFPAEHWQHIRSTNAIESTFSTVRLRTKKTRGQGTLEMTLAMVFKLAEKAQKRWKRLKGYKLIGKVIEGVTFKDGKEEILAA